MISLILALITINARPAQPLAEIQEKVREALVKNHGERIEVVLAPGVYRLAGPLEFTEADSGTDAAPVVWRAEDGAEAVITAAVEIPLSRFRPVKEATDGPKLIAAQLDDGFVAGYRLDNESTYPLPIPEVYIDGMRMIPARWPNEGWAVIDEIVDCGSKPFSGNAFDAIFGTNQGQEAPRGGSFRMNDPARFAKWKDEPNLILHGYWCFDWYESVMPVESLDVESGVFKFKTPHWYGLWMGNPNPRRWRAVNLKCELDAPGEFYVDRAERRLYLCPPAGFNPKSRVEILGTDGGDLIHACRTANVAFRSLIFEKGFMNAVKLDDCQRMAFDKCTFRLLRRTAVTMDRCSTCIVHGCEICYTGTGGVVLSGGDRKTLTPSKNRVEDCHIHHFSEQKLVYTPALQFKGVGNVMRRNFIHDAPHIAVAGSACNDNLLEDCVISNVCTAADDASAYYTGRDPSCRGNVIRRCTFVDIGSPKGHGTAAIYYDDGDGGGLVEDSTFIRCGEPGKGSFGTIFSHGGHSNVVRNCTFIDCKRPLGSAPWDQAQWEKTVRSDYWHKSLKENVDVESELYLSRYPELKGFMEPHPEELRWNVATSNLYINCGKELSVGKWIVDKTNKVLRK